MRICLALLLLSLTLVLKAQTDIPAQFPGGDIAYNNFLSQNLSYPESAMESKADRTIKVLVSIDSIGKARIQEFIYENSGLGFEEEVERFVAKMPNWTPALFNNIPSTSQIILSFNFKYQHSQPGGQDESYQISFYEVSDVPPFYEFGHDSLTKRMKVLLLDSLKLRHVNGTCKLQFIVDVEGNLLNVSILENSTEVSDRYIQYVFDQAGGWHPGLLKGKKVNVQTTTTFVFR